MQTENIKASPVWQDIKFCRTLKASLFLLISYVAVNLSDNFSIKVVAFDRNIWQSVRSKFGSVQLRTLALTCTERQVFISLNMKLE